MLAPWQLLAQEEEAKRELIWVALALLIAILVGAAIIALVERWRKRPFQEKLRASDQLAQFRTLYERGQLDPAEFEKIRALLTERMKQELQMPAPQPVAPPASGEGKPAASPPDTNNPPT